MRSIVLALVVVAALVAGCGGPEVCGGPRAFWREPGIWAALSERPDVARLVEPRWPAAPLAFDARAAGIAEPFLLARLHEVTWEPFEFPGVTVSARATDANRVVIVAERVNLTDAQARSILDAWLTLAGSDDPAIMREAGDDLVRDRGDFAASDSHVLDANVYPAPNYSATRRFLAEAEAPESRASLTSLSESWDAAGWRFDYALPVLEVVRGNATLQAGAADDAALVVAAASSAEPSTLNESDARVLATQMLATGGIAQPRFEDWRWSASRCGRVG